MESVDETLSGTGGGGARVGRDDGDVIFLCPFCGYTSPTVELHSGHFKICRKRISTDATEEGAGEFGDRGLLLGERRRRTGSREVECSGRLTASAAEVGDAARDGGNAEDVDRRNDNGTNVVYLTSHEINDMHTVNEQDEDIDAGTSSCKMSAAQSMLTQDLSSHETVVKNKKLTPETSTTDRDDIVTALATENSEKEWPVMDGDPSCPAASSEQLQDVASSVLPADPENAVRLGSEIPEYEVQTLGVVSLADGGISAISSVIAPSVDGIVGAPNIKDNDCLYGATGDITKRNVISSTAMPSQCELVEFNTCMMAQNEKVCLCQDKEQNKEVTADFASPEVIAETSVSTSSSIVLPHEGSTDTLEHMRGRGVLLETPTGFAVFIVKIPLDTETAWMHFMDTATANMVVSLIGFVKLDVKSTAWGEGDGGTSEYLGDLIRKSLEHKKELLVYTKFKDVIEEKLGITCWDDDGVAGDLIWGLKNVLREFIPEEKHSITKDYYFPLSKGWNDFLLKYSISVPATMRNSYLMSKIFLLRSLHLTLERVPRSLRESFDKRVNGIGNHIKDNFMYALVLARILVPELTPDYNFSKIFSSDMVLKIEEAKRFASNYHEERLTLYDRQIILGALDQLGVVPGQIESAVTFIKLRLKEIEVPTRHDEEEKMTWKDGHGERIMQNKKRSIWHPIAGLLVFGGIVMQMVTGC